MRSIPQLVSLDGRVALVVGGAGHIGRAMCDALRECGATVAVADRRPGQSEDTFFEVDLQDEAAARALPESVASQLGGLDILIHSAAFVGTTQLPGWGVPFADQTVAAWDAALRVNLTSAFVLAQSAHGLLSRAGHGSIILVSSIYGLVAPDMRLYAGTTMQNPTAYGASKAGLRQLGRYLSTLMAPEVRVNVVTPGGVARGQPEAFVRRYEDRVPLQRMATEEDLKGVTVFLASDLSAYVTGQELLVDGGWTAW